jgi:hypothetical protein
MAAGEGSDVAVNDERLSKRVRCAIDPCRFYWSGHAGGGAEVRPQVEA